MREFSTHSAIKGHVPNQSLYKGWEQSFPSFFLDQKMDIVSCQEGQFIKFRNENYFLLVSFKSKYICLHELGDNGYECNKQCCQMNANISFKILNVCDKHLQFI